MRIGEWGGCGQEVRGLDRKAGERRGRKRGEEERKAYLEESFDAPAEDLALSFVRAAWNKHTAQSAL